MLIAIGNPDKRLCLDLEIKINEFFSTYFDNFQYEIELFSGDPSGFLTFCLSNSPEIVFIGTSTPDTPGLGIRVGEIVRSNNPECHIIFFTNEDHYVKDSLSLLLRPSGYLIAPIDQDLLFDILHNIMVSYDDKKVLVITYKDKTYLVNVSDIISIQKIKRKIHITTVNQEVEYYDTLKNIMSQLDERFFMTEEGTIVNLDRVLSIDNSSNLIYLSNGKAVILARNRKKDLKNKLTHSIFRINRNIQMFMLLIPSVFFKSLYVKSLEFFLTN